MNADEFGKILDRFHEALADAAKDIACPWLEDLNQVWRDLNREYALMKDAERRSAEPLIFHHDKSDPAAGSVTPVR